MTSPQFDIGIIGGGWAGLAAAITAVEAGKTVVMFEAAPQWGGRARAQTLRITEVDKAFTLDNGQHLLIGAYRDCQMLMAKVAAEPLIRYPLALNSESGIQLRASAMGSFFPALIRRAFAFFAANGFSLSEKFQITRLLASLQRLQWDVACAKNETVSALLSRYKQSATLTNKFWRPLCVATMNTHPNIADAATFVRVLRDSFGASDWQATDFLIPASDLGSAFPEAAAKWLTKNGASLHLRSPLTTISRQDELFVLESGARVTAEKLVIATPPSVAHRLLTTAAKTYQAVEQIKPLNQFAYLPIATVYLGWPKHAESVFSGFPAVLMLNDTQDKARPGQWLFQRGLHEDYFIAAVVISAWSQEQDIARLEQDVAQQIATLNIGGAMLGMPVFAKAIVEKRATLACTPERPRIDAMFLSKTQPTHSEFSNIALAGDYCYSDYPATLEGAVRSGRLAVQHLM